MKIATWNINGVKARIDSLVTWLAAAKPDVVCLQEIKSVTEGFPAADIEALGYRVAVHGQKGFNGVALLSRHPMEDIRRGLPGEPDETQSRYIEALITTAKGVVRVGGLYLPNGNPFPGPKFDYKLAWMARLEAHARDLLALEEPLVLAGDYNVIPEPIDCKTPAAWLEDALFQPESRAAFRRLEALGLTDAIRATTPGPGVYTFWDYQAGAWQKDNGIRIDHLLLSPEATDRLTAAGIDRETRAWEKPSDHVPVWVELDIG
ncbi:MAG: exodeoxyribonuclease III [Hyphomicrobiaceae bacterium]